MTPTLASTNSALYVATSLDTLRRRHQNDLSEFNKGFVDGLDFAIAQLGFIISRDEMLSQPARTSAPVGNGQ